LALAFSFPFSFFLFIFIGTYHQFRQKVLGEGKRGKRKARAKEKKFNIVRP